MKRRTFIKAAWGTAASQFLALSHLPGAKPFKKPNLLYVFSDMQRASTIGCYGTPDVKTPVIDAFSSQGARFDSAMSSTPVCCPHRASLMSGLYCHHNGVLSNSVPFKHNVKCLAETFREAGYNTCYIGKWHIPDVTQEELGFSTVIKGAKGKKGGKAPAHHMIVDGKVVYRPTYLTDKTIEFIKEQKDSDKPWVLFLSWIPPHTPYKAPDKYTAHYMGKLTLPPNIPEGKPMEHALKDMPDYYGMVESLDFEFGRILKALNQSGAADDTIAVYSSDHGDMVGCQGYGKKRWPHEESARVPLFIRYPRTIKPGTVIDNPINTPDVYPTLAGLANVTAPEKLDGADFSAYITGKAKTPPRDYAYLSMPYAYVSWPGWRAIRTKNYMYACINTGPWLLFDIKNDPYQMKNLVNDKSSQSLVKKMDERLSLIMKETGASWEIKADKGDMKNWVPGGSKKKTHYMGVKWPGWIEPITGQKKKKGRKKKKKT